MTDETTLARGADFLWGHARLVERRIFERVFLGGPADAVVDAVRAYRNADGGLGHALEPDLRTPSSQPLFVDVGLAMLHEASANDPPLVVAACDFLASVARDDGAVSAVLSDALRHARADHWNGDYATTPSLRATAGVLARLHALGARHAWVDRATEWCLEQIAGRPNYTGHGMRNALEFLRHLPDRERARPLWDRVTSRLFEDDYVAMATPLRTYGLTPLRFAPSPNHPSRALFADADIERHLDHLLGEQQDDGGWPISWDPPGPAAVQEWRGRWTLDALLILRAYGRI